MKIIEHEVKDAESVWCVFSEDGRYGATVIRYANGAMKVIPTTSGTSCGKVDALDAKQWARDIAADYFQRNAIDNAKSNLDAALRRYQREIAKMPPIGSTALPPRKI